MAGPSDAPRNARCACGAVCFQIEGAPIMTVACYCHSCQQAARRLEALPGAPAMMEADGGTPFVMQRKDRLSCVTGAGHLKEFLLTPQAPTRRVVAACCNSAMFLEFKGGHWLSLYRNRFDKDDRPAIEMRTMTEDRPAGVNFADDLPSPRKHAFAFMWKLLTAWMAMGFKAPRIAYVKGSVDA